MKNQIQVEEQAPANANQLTSSAKGTKPKSASDRMAKLGEFRILTLRETPAFGKAENPEHSANYWRQNIDTDPRHNPDVEPLVCQCFAASSWRSVRDCGAGRCQC